MEMNEPAPPNAIDENRQGLIGRPMDRVDGALKVTGRAPYAYEVKQHGEAAYGWIVEAAIGKGRLASVDTGAAERAPGVLLVMTHRNTPAQPPYSTEGDDERFARSWPQLSDDEVRQYGEPVAFVVADSLEQARAAAALVRIEYAPQGGDYDLQANLSKAQRPQDESKGEPDTAEGDFNRGFEAAPVQLDVTYTTPYHIHAQMEPHASIAWWEGERLVVHCSTQKLESAQKRLAHTLQLPEEQVRVVSRYIGGGFGG